MLRNRQAKYFYLVNTEKLIVERFNFNNPIAMKDYMKKFASNKWFRTRKEVYLRYVTGQLTPASFKPTEYPTNSGKFVRANILY